MALIAKIRYVNAGSDERPEYTWQAMVEDTEREYSPGVFHIVDVMENPSVLGVMTRVCEEYPSLDEVVLEPKPEVHA